jgi:hypothetical protein
MLMAAYSSQNSHCFLHVPKSRDSVVNSDSLAMGSFPMVHPSSKDYTVVPLHSVSVDSNDGRRTDTDARHGGICGPASLVGICDSFVARRLLVQ